VLWPHFRGSGQEKLQQLLDKGGWRPVYRDSVGWLLARNSLELPANMSSAPDTPWRDLTVGQLAAWGGEPRKAVEYGVKTREAMPWHQGACNLLTNSYREVGDEPSADDILQQCRDYFPSKYLR
jgi:hypothetical protein